MQNRIYGSVSTWKRKGGVSKHHFDTPYQCRKALDVFNYILDSVQGQRGYYVRFLRTESAKGYDNPG